MENNCFFFHRLFMFMPKSISVWDDSGELFRWTDELPFFFLFLSFFYFWPIKPYCWEMFVTTFIITPVNTPATLLSGLLNICFHFTSVCVYVKKNSSIFYCYVSQQSIIYFVYRIFLGEILKLYSHWMNILSIRAWACKFFDERKVITDVDVSTVKLNELLMMTTITIVQL